LYLFEDTVQYNYVVQMKIGIAQMLKNIQHGAKYIDNAIKTNVGPIKRKLYVVAE